MAPRSPYTVVLRDGPFATADGTRWRQRRMPPRVLELDHIEGHRLSESGLVEEIRTGTITYRLVRMAGTEFTYAPADESAEVSQ